MNDDPISVNRRRWNEMATLHETTYFDSGAVASDDALKPFELDDLGRLDGQRVCHLQCHIAGDSLSLARLGATVVGVDFSDVAIETARRRARAAGLDARVSFVCASVDEATDRLDGDFDGIYTSWGVLCWLPDLHAWASTIHQLLRPSGWLYLAETHPYAAAHRLTGYPYGGAAAVFNDGQGDYSDAAAVFEHPESWEWTHGIGDVVTALATAGMRIESLRELPLAAWHLNDPEQLQRRPDGLWEVPGSTLPLSFTLRAIKE